MHNFLKTLGTSLILSFLFFACEKNKLNTKEIAREIEDRKIKRVTEIDLAEEGYRLGVRMLNNADSLWQALPESEKSAMVAQNNFETFEKILSEQTGAATVRIIDIKSPPKNLSKEEHSDAEAYAYSLEKNLPLEKNVYIREETVIFTGPLIILKNKKTPFLLHIMFSKKSLIRNMEAP